MEQIGHESLSKYKIAQGYRKEVDENIKVSPDISGIVP